MADLMKGWMKFRIACSLFGRMVWNLLCFDFTSVQIYAFIFYFHCFTKTISVERIDEAGEDQPGDCEAGENTEVIEEAELFSDDEEGD